ncbi:MAG: hypothetical protein AAF600_20455 [Bacteroidota bacterium]
MKKKFSRSNLKARKLKRWCYLWLGYGWINERMLQSKPKPGAHNPSNFALWVVTIYTALYSIAFQRFENRVNRLYTSYSAYVERLGSTEGAESTIQGFIDLQSRKVPMEINYWKPWTVVGSFFFNEYEGTIVKDVEDMVVDIFPYFLKVYNLCFLELANLRTSHSNLLFQEIENRSLSLQKFDINKASIQNSNIRLSFKPNSRIDTLQILKSELNLSVSYNNIINGFKSLIYIDNVESKKSNYKHSIVTSGNTSVLCSKTIVSSSSFFYKLDIRSDSIFYDNHDKLGMVLFYKCKFSSKTFFEPGQKQLFAHYKCEFDGKEKSNIAHDQALSLVQET